jgi:hypothetical protein
MTKLFVPPIGAMRFHCTFNPKLKKPVNFYVWVLPPVSRNSSYPLECDCGLVFPVVVESITKDVVDQGGRKKADACLCLCSGSIVE